ncbi:MAG: carboxyltransferase domain-containing protein, partial [Candidatus Marinimicrobia bacterium]|nr:carboxyltransferase domain-containing protein [Candidatus Neomarinimicrobiota bacterium]
MPASDRTILVQFGETISKNLHQQVFSFTRYLLDNPSPEILNIHPAYNSVMVTIANDASIGQVMNLLKVSKALVLDRGTSKSRDVEIPVLYKGMEGPDMGRVCEKTGLSTAEVIRRHSEPDYLVHFIGFSIG